MHPTTASAFADELEKIASTWDRQADWAADDRAKKAAEGVSGTVRRAVGKGMDAAYRRFSQMGPVGQSAVISGLMGGAIGASKGFTRSDPVYTPDGGARYPHVGDRLVRAGTGALTGGLTGAALGGGSIYLLRKALHG